MNDEAVIPSLQCLGIPLSRARDWSVIGCYEAAPTGDCYPNTVIGGMHLPELLNQTVARSEVESFAQFLDEFLATVRTEYEERVLPGCQARWEHWRDRAPSPFGSILMRGCIDALACLETGAAPYNLAGINILGLGTAVDGLLAIRQHVFTTRRLSLEDLRLELAGDFPNEPVRRLLAATDGRFGTDSPDSNALAEQLSEMIAKMIAASQFGPGVRPCAGFFRFLADVHQVGQPSPDGRRKGALISYGCGPASGVTDSATTLLASCTHVAHASAACGNPVLLNLSPEDCAGEAGRRRLDALLRTYFSQGGSHLHMNITAATDLRQAQQQPEEHADLTVRVSGFSARFVKLDSSVQNALIERTAMGER
jgi:formate C-acetyltransferase